MYGPLKALGGWIPAKEFAEKEPEAWTPFLLCTHSGKLSSCRVLPRMIVASDVELTAKTCPDGRIFKIARQHGAAVLKLAWPHSKNGSLVKWKQGKLPGRQGQLMEYDLEDKVLYFLDKDGIHRVCIEDTNMAWLLNTKP